MTKKAVIKRVALLINAANATPKRGMAASDQKLVGLWSVEVDQELSENDRADAELAAFLESKGVEAEDDFEFDVVDPATSKVLKGCGHESCTRLSGRAKVGTKTDKQALVARSFRVSGLDDAGAAVDCGVVRVACLSVGSGRELALDMLWDERLSCAGLRRSVETVG